MGIFFQVHLGKTLLAVVLGTLIFNLEKTVQAEETAEIILLAQLNNKNVAEKNARQLIQELHDHLIEGTKKNNILERQKFLAPIIRKVFNFSSMAQFSIGRYWANMAKSQQDSWVSIFGDMSIATYASRFSSFSGQSFEIIGVESTAAGEGIWVKTQLILGDKTRQPISINYFFQEGKVVDVLLNGSISEMATRRSEYTSVIRSQSVDALLLAVKKQTENLLK
ncbi:MAG: ABC transporter substrate-binding protein [Rhodospirillaceae bacterium]|nr:ABC transporter substrate-binding protein [Rhodospirillaceae bacterium]